MELSLYTSSHGFSTPTIFRRHSSLHISILLPTKVNCVAKRCPQYHILSAPKVYNDHNNIDLFYQSKISFPKITPEISYGRNAIPLIKAKTDQTGADTARSPLTKVLEFYDALLQFLRPQFLYGTVAAFAAIMTRTWMENAHLVMLPKWILLLRAIVALVALLSADGFVTGINQIYDIEIDKINKPHYPLVTGKLSLQSAWIMLSSFVTIGVTIPLLLKSGSLLTYVLSYFVLGSLYSVPPVATKRSTIGAIITCASLRGFTYILGLSAASRAVLGLPFQLSPPVIFMAIFSTFFTLACGAIKDIEDLEGDKNYDVPTLASIYGPRKIAFFGFGLMVLDYAGAIITPILMPQVFRQSIMIPAHVILASYLISQAWKLEKAKYTKEVSQSVYLSMWKLFTTEFILFSFI